MLPLAESTAAVVQIVRSMRFMSDVDAANTLLACVREALAQQEAPMQGLTPGRIVHYVAYGTPSGEFPAGAHRAAIITQLDNVGLGQFEKAPEVSLCVFNPTGLHFRSSVPFDDDQKKPGTWHWIEPA